MRPALLFAPLAAALLAGLPACAPLPAGTAGSAGPDAPPPALLPLDDILAQAGSVGAAADPGEALAARAARLRARAALMQGPVLDPDTRARLARAIRLGRA